MWRIQFTLPAALLNVTLLLGAFSTASAQPPPNDHGPNSPQWPGNRGALGPMGPDRPPMERAFHAGPPGRWWMNPALVQRLGLTADQQKRMDAIFQQNRLRLIDMSAALQKEEAIMEPLLEGDHPDEAQVVAQIDHIAQARTELEKINARMLLGFRSVLTPEQWKKLQSDRPPNRDQHR